MKQQTTYTLALLMPLVIATAIIGLVFVPRTLIKPQDEFLVSVINPFCHSGFYQVEQQHLVFVANSKNSELCSNPTAPLLYRYDLTKHQLLSISYHEAKNLTLDSSRTSPQGLTVALDHGNFQNSILDFMLFRFRYYLIGHGYSEGLSIPLDNHKQISKVTFIGWIRYDKQTANA